jgi:LacI family transcriptional regulator
MATFYRNLRKPVVEVFERDSRAHFPRILPDDGATGRMAAEHFLQRGFRNFGFFGDGKMSWVREREAGFRREIEQVFAARAQTTGSDEPFTISSFERGKQLVGAAIGGNLHRRQSATMGEWLVSLPKPVGVLAANDLWGFELVQAARERELHVPDDIAILGIDNDELLCEISHPPLSSIRIGGEQMGQQAVALLERLLAGEAQSAGEAERVSPLGIVTRQSTDVLAVDDAEVAAAVRHIRQHAFEGFKCEATARRGRGKPPHSGAAVS